MSDFWSKHKAKLIATMSTAIVGGAVTFSINWMTNVSEQLEEFDVRQRTAYQLHHEQEQADRRQWERIGGNGTTARANAEVIKMLQLFAVGGQLDIEKLQKTVEVMHELHDADIDVENIKMLIEMIKAAKDLFPGSDDDPKKPDRPTLKLDPPNTAQQQMPDQRPLSREELDRYIQNKHHSRSKK